MLNTYEKRLFVLLMISVLILQVLYMTSNPFDLFLVIGIDVLIFFSVWIIVLDKITVYPDKPKSDYIGYGTSMYDAVYGRKYRYDLIVDQKNNMKM